MFLIGSDIASESTRQRKQREAGTDVGDGRQWTVRPPRVTGTLAAGQTGLWIVVRQFDGNGDNWSTGSIYLWGACLQQGTDPKKGYARTWAYQAAPIAAGVACGAILVVGKDTSESPFTVRGPGSPLADHTLVEVTAGGELIASEAMYKIRRPLEFS